jgi:hypothetical protein
MLQISKIHMDECGKIVVVNLEPVIQKPRPKDDMPHWRSWQQICIEVSASPNRSLLAMLTDFHQVTLGKSDIRAESSN